MSELSARQDDQLPRYEEIQQPPSDYHEVIELPDTSHKLTACCSSGMLMRLVEIVQTSVGSGK